LPGLCTYFSSIKARFQSDLKQNAKICPVLELVAFEKSPAPSASEYGRPLSEPAISRQSLIAITKAAQEYRLFSFETLYRTGSCFAYGIDSKKERFANS
jgi:hypothetical protein